MKSRLLALPVVLYLFGIAYFLAAPGRFDSFPLDDGWIHQVYARSFAAGHGFEYNAGRQEAGATSPLWVIVTAPVHWFAGGNSHAVVAGVMVIGMLFGLASILLLWGLTRRVARSSAVACVASSVLALEPRLVFSSLSGMETTLLVALWLGGLWAALDRRWLWFMILSALMPVTRPETLMILPLCAVALLLSGIPWRRKLILLPVLALPFAMWGCFCHTTTGRWLPNTYMKAHPFLLTGEMFANAWHIVTGQGLGSLAVFPVGLAICLFEMVRRRRALELTFVLVAPLLYVIGVAGTRELLISGYYWTRWLDPASLILTAASGLGFGLLAGGGMAPLSRTRIPSRRWRIGTIAIGALVLALSVRGFSSSFAERSGHFRSDSHAIDAMNIRTGMWIRDHTPADAVVGVNDAGAIRYFGNRRTIDLVGINNNDLAFRPTSFRTEMEKCTWLAIFPSWFPEIGWFIRENFKLAAVIKIPPEQYTVCDCPSQSIIAIFAKNP